MKKLSIQIMALCSVFGFASGVMAEDCKPAPDCAALGFTQNASDCSGQGGKRSAPPAMAPWRDERTAGFPLPHGNFFRQHERNFVN